MIDNWNKESQNPLSGTPLAVSSRLKTIEEEIIIISGLPANEDPDASRRLIKLLKEEMDIRLVHIPKAMASDQMGHVDSSVTTELIQKLDPLNALLVTIYFFLYNYDKLKQSNFNSILYSLREVFISNKVETHNIFHAQSNILKEIIPVLFPLLTADVINIIDIKLIQELGLFIKSDDNNSNHKYANFNYISMILRDIFFKYFPVSMVQCRTEWFRLLAQPFTEKELKQAGVLDKISNIFNLCIFEDIDSQKLPTKMEEIQLEKIRSLLGNGSSSFFSDPGNIFNFLWIQIGKDKTLPLIKEEIDRIAESDVKEWLSTSKKLLQLFFFIPEYIILDELEKNRNSEDLIFYSLFISKLACKAACQGKNTFSLELVEKIILSLDSKKNKFEKRDVFIIWETIKFSLAAIFMIPSDSGNKERITFFRNLFVELLLINIEDQKKSLETSKTNENLEYYPALFIRILTAPFFELLELEPWEHTELNYIENNIEWINLELMFSLFLDSGFSILPDYLYKYIITESISKIASSTLLPLLLLNKTIEYFERRILVILSEDIPEKNIIWINGFTTLLGVYTKMGLLDKADKLWEDYLDYRPWYSDSICLYAAAKYEKNNDQEEYLSLIKEIIEFPDMPDYYKDFSYAVLEEVKTRNFSKDNLYLLLKHMVNFGSEYYLDKSYEEELFKLGKYIINCSFYNFPKTFSNGLTNSAIIFKQKAYQLRNFIENNQYQEGIKLYSDIIEIINGKNIDTIKDTYSLSLSLSNKLRDIEAFCIGGDMDEALELIKNLDSLDRISESAKNLALFGFTNEAELILEKFTDMDNSMGSFLNIAVVNIITGKDDLVEKLLNKYLVKYFDPISELHILAEVGALFYRNNYLDLWVEKIPAVCERSGYLEAADYPELYMRYFFDMGRTDLLDHLLYFYNITADQGYSYENDSDWHLAIYQILLNCEYRGLNKEAEFWADNYISFLVGKLESLGDISISVEYVLNSINRLFPGKNTSILRNYLEKTTILDKNSKSMSEYSEQTNLKIIAIHLKVLLDVKRYKEAADYIKENDFNISNLDYNLVFFTTSSSLEQSSTGYAGIVKLFLEKLSENTNIESIKTCNKIILTWTSNIIPVDAALRPILRSCAGFAFLTIESKLAIFNALERFEFAGAHSLEN